MGENPLQVRVLPPVLMRIWDIKPSVLDRQRLLGEHRELHAIWNIITQNKKGYSQHPETKRWVGKLLALYLRHEELVTEMIRRGYNHRSPLDRELAIGQKIQDVLITPVEEQKIILFKKQGVLYKKEDS